MVTHHMPKTSYEHIGVRETGAAVALEKVGHCDSESNN